jgi:pimeloyl-ACP methyl ester carboxylesterase
VDRTSFEVETRAGTLGGWYAGDGPPVLALHGGPGLSFDYLDDPVLELADRYQVATFQQRGLAPSVTTGDLTVEEAVADIAAVLDGLGWQTAALMGHSWGGHLSLHAAAAMPDRLDAVLAVDPLGAVGDGGSAEFGAAMRAGVPADELERLQALEAKEEAGEGTDAEALESLSLVWPAYFADPAAAPPMPPVSLSSEANLRLWTDLVERLPELEASLPSIGLPVGFLMGGSSPMPVDCGRLAAERLPDAWVEVVPDAGHFVWHEAPGSVVAAMDRLLSR